MRKSQPDQPCPGGIRSQQPCQVPRAWEKKGGRGRRFPSIGVARRRSWSPVARCCGAYSVTFSPSNSPSAKSPCWLSITASCPLSACNLAPSVIDPPLPPTNCATRWWGPKVVSSKRKLLLSGTECPVSWQKQRNVERKEQQRRGTEGARKKRPEGATRRGGLPRRGHPEAATASLRRRPPEESGEGFWNAEQLDRDLSSV